MQRIVYGIFPDRESAEAAKHKLQAKADSIDEEHEVATAAIHEHEIRPEDLPPAGRSARQAAAVGGIFVAVFVGLVLGLLSTGVFARIGAPETILGTDLTGVVVVSLVAGVFGAVVSGIGGSAENHTHLRELERAVSKGHVVLTAEASFDRVRSIARKMKRGGASRTGSL
ncbi:hypothetical protein DB30_03667 [Enhygromyxa salina]|uniref:Uncharacterized protein n=1 Tax=Enhygromyxa salina TaxID=215803 RepID=A0A0C2D5W7_9BACT|nr:hypothetical protein [Enhygromyxa salina]KIG17070.1 hypothetical protein DB30_03667 [Enhygromyxa salina]